MDVLFLVSRRRPGGKGRRLEFYIRRHDDCCCATRQQECAEQLDTCVDGVSASHLVQRFRQPHPKAPVPDS